MPIIINSFYNNNNLFKRPNVVTETGQFNLPVFNFCFSVVLIIILKLLNGCVLVGWRTFKPTNHEFYLFVQGSNWIAAVGPAS